jgi:hypothetical protein
MVGWAAATGQTFVTPASLADPRASREAMVLHDRALPQLMDLLNSSGALASSGLDYWFLFCFFDGWRERVAFSSEYHYVAPGDLAGCAAWAGPAGSIPRLTAGRDWVACFAAHRGDPSACLLPEAHFLKTSGYRTLFAELAPAVRDWSARRLRCVFAAGNHGEASNFFEPRPRDALHPRQHAAAVIAHGALPVDVYLGRHLTRAAQLEYRYLLDIDGYVRTWDAWAWKMMSGSLVLAVASPWETFFTREFEPWLHFVPVANDCSDLGARIDWCLGHDRECRDIAAAARVQAQRVYDRAFVSARVGDDLRRRLGQ